MKDLKALSPKELLQFHSGALMFIVPSVCQSLYEILDKGLELPDGFQDPSNVVPSAMKMVMDCKDNKSFTSILVKLGFPKEMPKQIIDLYFETKKEFEKGASVDSMLKNVLSKEKLFKSKYTA